MEHLGGWGHESGLGSAMPFRDLGFLPQTEATEIKCSKEIFKIQGIRLRRYRQGAARFFHEAQAQRLWPV